jgi:hypothetical protein
MMLPVLPHSLLNGRTEKYDLKALTQDLKALTQDLKARAGICC